jgi:hypothetical protein
LSIQHHTPRRSATPTTLDIPTWYVWRQLHFPYLFWFLNSTKNQNNLWYTNLRTGLLHKPRCFIPWDSILTMFQIIYVLYIPSYLIPKPKI